MNDRNNATLRVEGARVSTTDSRDDGRFHLRVNDDASGTCLMDLYLTPAQWLSLSGGASVKVEAWMVPPDQRDRLGKQLEVLSVDVPRDVADGYSSGKGRDTAQQRAREWADQRIAESEWEDYHDPRLSNRGAWVVVFQRWVDTKAVV